MGNCHFKTDFDAENITGKYQMKLPYVNAQQLINLMDQ